MIRHFFIKFVLFFTFFGSVCGYARVNRIGMDIEPIVGYERTQKLRPTPHTKDRLVYGARVTWGLLLLSLEAELLRAQDTETFADATTTRDTTMRAKLGLRSRISVGREIRLIVRAGAQATHNVHEELDSGGGILSTTTDDIAYKPYAGAGFWVNILGNFYFFTELTVVFTNFPNNYAQNDYQLTSGFTIRFP